MTQEQLAEYADNRLVKVYKSSENQKQDYKFGFDIDGRDNLLLSELDFWQKANIEKKEQIMKSIENQKSFFVDFENECGKGLYFCTMK